MTSKNVLWLSLKRPTFEKIEKLNKKGQYLLEDRKLNSYLLKEEELENNLSTINRLIEIYKISKVYIDVDDFKHLTVYIDRLQHIAVLYI